ncbi:MAG: antibiotic biosynthesis monooxygenase [Actinomycetota bacterium]|nr:antibiotic biosynthesis monooxygenase [Actinomycetota bacterium]
MSIVKINALDVPSHQAKTLEERFANRAGEVERLPGFEGFSLLRPTDDGGRYFVVTRWRSEEDFERWLDSPEFQHGHAQTTGHGPVATHSKLLSFEVVLESGGGSLKPMAD